MSRPDCRNRLAMPNPRATVETYFADLRRTRASEGATEERSSYGALATLLNTVGWMLKPKVFCVGELADQGAGHPDFGLYAANQLQRGRPRPGQTPHRGVVEVKGVEEDVWHTAESDQVRRYLGRTLLPDEVEYFSHTSRRIAAILETTSSDKFVAARSSVR